jgi:hypothetical protein
MKLIAHRGLTTGPNKNFENQPNQIKLAIEQGFDCEVDLWVFENRLYLGHDGPQYNITEKFLKQPGLWIHCKHLPALEYCQNDNKALECNNQTTVNQIKTTSIPLDTTKTICDYCGKEFSCYNSMNRHMQKCKVKETLKKENAKR